MRHNLCRALVAVALVLAAVSLAGCAMEPANILVEFEPETVELRPNEAFDVNITLIANGVGFFRLDAVKLTFADALGNPTVFPPSAGIDNPYVVQMTQDIPVLGLAGTILSGGLLSNYVDEDVRTLPMDAWLLAPNFPASLTIELIDTRGMLRGGGELGLDWDVI